MKFYFTLFSAVSFCFLFHSESSAQCNTSPCIIPIPSVNAQDACVLPYPEALDCYYGTTTPDAPVSFPPSWCTVINNNHFFAFTATGPTATFSISTFGCAQGNGIQAAVLSTADCINFQFVSACLGNIASGTTQTLTATGLTPGEVYYLCIDGSAGAICDYAINGSVPDVIPGPIDPCIPSSPTTSYSTAAVSTWYIDPPGAGNILGNPVSNMINVQWLQPGPAQVCAQNVTCPDAPTDCVDVIVGEDTQSTETVDLCQGKTTTCAGRTFSAPGTFPVTLSTYTGCDSVVSCIVKLIPKIMTLENHYMCQGDVASCAGQEFSGPGTFPVTLTNYQGCDSVVSCKINLVPTYNSPLKNVNFCGPADYVVCDNTFSSSGIYSEICQGYLGCDSVVNINLAIMQPVAGIDPPPVLGCGSNSTITLTSTSSNQNDAPGGITQYFWTGPGIVGPNNQPTVQVNKAGDYCLRLTHTRGGVFCHDSTCVTVLPNTAVPQRPQLAGIQIACEGDSLSYTVTPVGTPLPTSYGWSIPNNIPFTQINPTTIQIAWNNTAGGQLCVTANNDCGSSLPACLPITVNPQPIPPQLAGPDTVCSNGGSYLYHFPNQQAGTTYNWTVPSGAILAGSGDSVSVDFTNAVSGQVCVSAQNSCGNAGPVCRTVQVKPAPSADLNGAPEICAGESVNLAFTLTGTGPFDVVWSDGAQNFILNDISNGHIVTVNPTQHTTYRLLSIGDQGTPTCSSTSNDSVSVSVWSPAQTNQAFQICQGETMLLGGAQQGASGVYYDSLATVHGCDSVVISTLTVFAADTILIEQNTCDPALAGTFVQNLSNQAGCDSTVTTVVTLLPSNIIEIFDTSCDPASVGVFVQNLTNQYGCDSTVTTTITYLDSDTTYLSATTCNTSAVGVFTQNLTALDGCDSLVITTVSFIPLDTTYLTATNCDPAAVGTFYQTLVTAGGCDSTLATTITLLPSDTTLISAADCDPANVGTFVQNLSNQYGCDSTVITTVALLSSDITQLTAADCDPANVGTFVQNLSNRFGCDSTVITTVSLLPSNTTQLTGTDCNPANVGTFVENLTNRFGCDSIVTTVITLVYNDTTYLTAQSCNPGQVGIFPQILNDIAGCDSVVVTTVSFFQIDTTYLSASTCDPSAAGIFSQTLLTAAGCDSAIVTNVALLPSNQTAIQSTTCDPSAAGVFTYPLVNQYGCDSIVTETVTLLPSSATTLNFTTCEQAEVGTTAQTLVNQYGCDSVVTSITTLRPIEACSVAATLAGSDIPCGSNTGSLTLSVTLGLPPYTYTVLSGNTPVASGAVTSNSTPQAIPGLPAGNYTAVITASTGYTTTAQATIVQLVPPVLTTKVSSDYSGFAISCTGAADGSALATATGGKQPFNFAWSNGATTAQTGNLTAGAYSVTVTDANNCTAAGSVLLNEPQPMQLAFTVNNPNCFGQKHGTIIASASGGTLPYRFSLNDGAFQGNNVFLGLDAGSYTIIAQDANGCETEEIILINAPVLVDVELGDNIKISLGDNATLEAVVNVPFDSLTSVVWTPLDSLSECPECLTQTVAPLISTTYSISVQASNGCRDDDKVTVIVDRRRHIYVPNIFSPNGDGINDVFSVFPKPNTVRSIKTFQVFDRWGELVYTAPEFGPNDPGIGWDGRLRGKEMPPAVFAWVIEVEFIDGVTEVFNGDVTLTK